MEGMVDRIGLLNPSPNYKFSLQLFPLQFMCDVKADWENFLWGGGCNGALGYRRKEENAEENVRPNS